MTTLPLPRGSGRDIITQGSIVMSKICTKSNTTNMLTNILSSDYFRFCLSLIEAVQEYNELVEGSWRLMDSRNFSQGG